MRDFTRSTSDQGDFGSVETVGLQPDWLFFAVIALAILVVIGAVCAWLVERLR